VADDIRGAARFLIQNAAKMPVDEARKALSRMRNLV
jgi:hypothetical protein